MSKEIIFCWSPWFLIPLMDIYPYMSIVHSHLSLLMLLFLHVLFDRNYLYIYSFSQCVPFLSELVVLSLLSDLRRFIPLVIAGKGIPVSIFQHMVVRLIPCTHRFYILSLILQKIILVGKICLTFIPLKKLVFLSSSSLLTLFYFSWEWSYIE